MENLVGDLVKFTPGAIRQLGQLKNSEKLEGGKIRIGVEGGGCAGLSYILQYDQPKEGDMELDIEGISLLINKAHGLYLSGITIDYKEGLSARGFTFENPNAKTTCGCGSSFGI
jgi:iron-sulfur cluster assembly protein